MRWDVEIALAQNVVDYLKDSVWDQIQATCPIVTFFDPMSQDDASRIVVEVPQSSSSVSDAAHWAAAMEVTVKSQWAQASLAADYADHSLRVNAVRDKLFPVDIVTRLQTFCQDGMKINYVQPRRDCSTATQDGWIHSSIRFEIDVYMVIQS